MTDKLKPCPGCGKENARVLVGHRYEFVHCPWGWSGPERTFTVDAISAWNRRTEPRIPEIPARTPPIHTDLLDDGEELDDPACYCPCHQDDPCRACCEKFRAEEEPKNDR